MSSRMGGDHDQPSDAEMEDRYDQAAIQVLQRDKVPITASRIRKRTGPSVTLDEIPAPRRGGMSGATHS